MSGPSGSPDATSRPSEVEGDRIPPANLTPNAVAPGHDSDTPIVDPQVGADATEWARGLTSPRTGPDAQLNPTPRQTTPAPDQQAQPGNESLVAYLYKGNLQGFWRGTAATVVASGVSAIAAAVASHMGCSPLTTASIAGAVTYIWYPVKQGLDHFLDDRKILKERAEQGDDSAKFRIWASRVTQFVIGESIWLGALIPAQVYLANHGFAAAGASLTAHWLIGTALNLGFITPYRNVSQWIWGFDAPRKGSTEREP